MCLFLSSCFASSASKLVLKFLFSAQLVQTLSQVEVLFSVFWFSEAIILKYHKWYLRQISCTIHAINCLYYNLRNSVIQLHVFIFVELFRFVGEQIGFEVHSCFRPSWSRHCARSMHFSQYFGFPNFLLVLESPDLKILKSFHHFCDKIIW